MEQQIQNVSIQQMKDALSKEVSSKFPVKLTQNDGKVMVRYIRGFADPQSNIVLYSETSYSLALKILEVKEIRALEYTPEHPERAFKILQAKWLK